MNTHGKAAMPMPSANTYDLAVSAGKKGYDTCGVFICQYADCRVSSEWFYGRTRTMNNKGILDEYRRPKLAADSVRDVLKKSRAADLSFRTRNP